MARPYNIIDGGGDSTPASVPGAAMAEKLTYISPADLAAASAAKYGTTTPTQTTTSTTTSGYVTPGDLAAISAAKYGTTPAGVPVSSLPQQAVVTGSGTVPTGGSGGSTPEISAEQRDAFKLLEDVFTSYGLASLVPKIRELMIGIKDPATGKIQQIGPNEATVILRQTPEYQARFAGNYDPKTGRVARGLNALTEREYLAQENAYSELFRKYGVQDLATKQKMSDLIGSDISNVELNNRLNLAVMNVQNADPSVMATLKAYYPGVSQKDLVSYFLAPEETLPALERKVTAAEIGGAAMMQGFKTDTGLPSVSMTRAEQLAQAGVTGEKAQAEYGKIRFELPTATKLSAIYGGQTGKTYGQTELENQYLLSSGEAAQRQRDLNKLEVAQFGASTGTNANVEFLRRPTTGKF